MMGLTPCGLRACSTFWPGPARGRRSFRSLRAPPPDLMARVVDEGHEVGLHCEEHVRHSTRDAAWGRADTARALERLRAVGVAPRLWRTPWGDLAPWTAEVAAELGLRIVGWAVDTPDWPGG